MTATVIPFPTVATAPAAAPRREYALRWCHGCVTPARRRSIMLARLRRAGLWQLCPTCTGKVVADVRLYGRAPASPEWIDPDEVRAILNRDGQPVDPWFVLNGVAA
jgi:hypothetical protein